MTVLTAEELLARLTADPGTAGLFCDFDGTLTPIVLDPASSRLPQPLAGVLADLAARLGVLAVVSGRPVTFLAERASVPGVRLLGLYGLQEWLDGRVVVRPEAASWQPAVDAARARLAEEVERLEGVRLEDKGLSLALHWRGAPDLDAAARAAHELATAVAAQTGLSVERGKLVEELRPPVAWDKGSGVLALVEECGLREVVFVGDDLGDLAAFRAVREHGGAAVAVDAGEETDPRLLAAADVVLPGTDAVAEWLYRLRDVLERHHAGRPRGPGRGPD
jgi:trehalose 6-phosphate phosphatase